MRRNIVIILLTVAMLTVGKGGVWAQRPIGDTLTAFAEDSSYYTSGYEWSSDSWFSWRLDALIWNSAADYYVCESHLDSGPLNPAENCSSPENFIEGVQMTTDRPLKILGIAACAYAQDLEDGTPVRIDNVSDTSMSGRNTDSLILYKPTPSGPLMLAGGPWRMEQPQRYMVLPRPDTVPYSCPQIGLHPWLLPTPVSAVYEVMFDKPQVVTDSFIVTGTANNNHKFVTWDDYGRYECWWEHRPTRYWTVKKLETTPDTNQVCWIWLSWREEWYRSCFSCYRTPAGNFWRHFPLIVPIIDPDFDTVLCDAVRDVRLADSTDTTLTLMWTGGNNVQWEVQYMEVNGTTVQTVSTAVPMVTLRGLRERTNYMVRVRGMCEWDTEYGEWSGWLDVFTGAHHEGPVSISNLERFTQLVPNPARGEVTVLSSYRLRRVVVYDLSGHAVLEQEAGGLAATIGLGALSKGVYVVAIHTPAGTATKRLVVE